MVAVRLAQQMGAFKGWRGDTAVDTAPFPSWHRPPSRRRDLVSVNITAG